MMELPPDPIDRAADQTDRERAESIAAILAQPALPMTGFCLWCKCPVPNGRFCDSDCAQDWHKAARMKGR